MDFGSSQEGVVGVEFALVASVLLAMLAASIDLSFMVGARRDAERISTLMTKALSSCPPRSSDATLSQGTDCVTDTIEYMAKQKPNIVVSYPTATLGLGHFVRQTAAPGYSKCPGVMTDLEQSDPAVVDIKNKFISNFRNEDDGVVAYITINYTPFLPQVLATFFNVSLTKYTEVSLDLRGNGPSYKCS